MQKHQLQPLLIGAEVGLIHISLPFCQRPVLHGELSGEQPHAWNLKARLRQTHEPHPPLKLRVKLRKTPDVNINDLCDASLTRKT